MKGAGGRVIELPKHKDSHPNGGMKMLDEGNILPGAFKEVCGKLAKKLVLGEF
jgi:hypothetical protein